MSNNKFMQNIENIPSNDLNWIIIQKDMRTKLGNDIYDSWLRKIEFVEEMNNYVLLSVSTRFIRDWITSRYLDQILQIIRSYKKDITRIEFKIIENNKHTAKDGTRDFEQLNNEKNVSFIKDTYNSYGCY